MITIRSKSKSVKPDQTVITTTAYHNSKVIGELVVESHQQQLSLVSVTATLKFSNEENDQLRMGLLRHSLSCANQISPFNVLTGFIKAEELFYIEQLFPVFENSYKKGQCYLSKYFTKRFLITNFSPSGDYIIAKHGEKIVTSNKKMLAVEGRFETETPMTSTLSSNGTRGMELFYSRERFISGDTFKRMSVYALANGQLIEALDNMDETKRSNTAPYGVSAYNGFLFSYVLVALHELGWFKIASDTETPHSLQSDAELLKCDKTILGYLLDFIEGAGIINYTTNEKDYTVCNPAFKTISDEVGYVKFIVQGYTTVLNEIPALARGEKKYWRDLKRNDDGVSEFLLTYHQNVEPAVFETVKDVQFKKMAYLGCGSGKRLIDLCLANKDSKAIGVEIDPVVARKARENIEAAGLSDRIEIVEEDLMEWALKPHEDVDCVLFIMGMAHDFLKSKDRAYRVFYEMKTNLAPGAKMILEDINIQETADPWAGMTINKGFELVHALMGVNLGTRDKYVQVFESFGWEVEFVRGTGLPQAWIYVLKSDIEPNANPSTSLTLEETVIL